MKGIKHFTKERAKVDRKMKEVYSVMDDEFNGCFNCGTWNNPTHAHLVPKSRRRDLIAEPENIIHLCMECHRVLDHTGNRSNLRRWPEILSKIKDLDREYYELIK